MVISDVRSMAVISCITCNLTQAKKLHVAITSSFSQFAMVAT
ncbi:hypothetical protein FHS76_004237 [Ochrobactrum daejeonense]|uniref:Uncharacterized protein n=1 Tax=Brucella daejeonensis TaxID=659015 RepID=A0A7W9B155_9HYPH|nr:hypothetical protein [Brucella daejeonensis]